MDTPQTEVHKNKKISQLLEAHQNQLLDLRLSLNQAYKKGSLSTSAYNRRLKKLLETQKKLSYLQYWFSTEEAQLQSDRNLGLPNLAQCRPDEKEICRRYLQARLNKLQSLNKLCLRITRYSRAISSGWLWAWVAPLRLSWLKKQLQTLEQEHQALKFDAELIGEYTDKVGQLFRPYPPKQKLLESIKLVMKLFYRLDEICSQIVQLRSAIRAKEHQLKVMEQWVREHQHKVDAPLQYIRPPEANETMRVAEQMGVEPPRSAASAARRLTLAKQLLNSIAEEQKIEFTNAQVGDNKQGDAQPEVKRFGATVNWYTVGQKKEYECKKL